MMVKSRVAKRTKFARTHRDLNVYNVAFRAAMSIF